MPTSLDEYWDIVVDSVKRRVAANSSAEIREVIESLLDNTIPRNLGVDDGDLEIIIGKLTQTNEYTCFRKGIEFHIKKNPSFELDQNIQDTNRSVQSLNTALFWTNIISTLIAFITGFFIALTFFKNDSRDLQLLNSKLQRQEQILDSMLRSQMEIDSAIQKAVKDSLYQKRK